MAQIQSETERAADELTQLLTTTGYRVEELAGADGLAILDVFSGGTEGQDGYLYTLTASVTP